MRNYRISRAQDEAHASRKFDEAFKVLKRKGKSAEKVQKQSRAFQALSWIRMLCEIEREARGMTADERHRLRQDRARPILDMIDESRKEATK